MKKCNLPYVNPSPFWKVLVCFIILSDSVSVAVSILANTAPFDLSN